MGCALIFYGLMYGDANAYAGDPYDVDVLFMYGKYGVNSSMNTRGVIDMLIKPTLTLGNTHSKIIYSCLFIGNGSICGFDSPDTTYLDAMIVSHFRSLICEPDTVADAIRWPVVKPDRDVRGSSPFYLI